MLSHTLCDPVDCSPPGSCIHGILQARILEWVAIPSLQGIFLTQGSDPGLLHRKQTLHHFSLQVFSFFFNPCKKKSNLSLYLRQA